MKKILFLIFSISILSIAKHPAPKLVVFISVDQMRPDYFERYGHLLTGGLHRLYSQGIVYTNADLNYAASETGPGHATLGSGCYPAKNGILGNEWIDPKTKKSIYCVEDSLSKEVDGEGGGFSPKNLMVPAIGDWLKKSSSDSKVITVSSKDRAAILMGGWKPDFVFWYGKKNGTMVTSDYYMKSLPSWAKKFNTSGWIAENVPDRWEKSLPDSVYKKIGPDEFSSEQQKNNSSSFPHEFDANKKNEQILGTPYGDLFTIDFALSAIEGEKLGLRNETDIICISLSNCDYVGHGYGPDSHEILDLLIKVDIGLGKLFSKLDESVGKENYVVALSADHAVCTLPEFNRQYNNIPAKRYIYATDIKPILDSVSRSLKDRVQSTRDIIVKNSFIDYTATSEAGWDREKTNQEIRNGLLHCGAYVDIYFRDELMGSKSSTKPFMEKYRNSYYEPRGEDYQYRVRENCLISSRTTGTTHGSPYPYDTHVPLMFWWSGATPQKIDRSVHSADAAPTLAKFSGFQYPANLDGVPLSEVAD